VSLPPKTLDPARSLADLAVLMARLADPFSKRALTLAEADASEPVLQAAQLRWSTELKGDAASARRYREIFAGERARLRGESSAVTTSVASGAPPPGPAPVGLQAVSSADETALAPMLSLPPGAMPFVEGRFEPAPALPSRPSDAGGTLLTPQIEMETLPFVRVLPSQSLKKKR
jgi:hypothetical protein